MSSDTLFDSPGILSMCPICLRFRNSMTTTPNDRSGGPELVPLCDSVATPAGQALGAGFSPGGVYARATTGEQRPGGRGGDDGGWAAAGADDVSFDAIATVVGRFPAQAIEVQVDFGGIAGVYLGVRSGAGDMHVCVRLVLLMVISVVFCRHVDTRITRVCDRYRCV